MLLFPLERLNDQEYNGDTKEKYNISNNQKKRTTAKKHIRP